MRLAISEIIEATSGEAIVAPASADALVVGLTWDSRNVSAGCLYVALPGERVDGHTFVTGAIEAGAACALVTQEPDAAAIDAARTAGAAIVLVSDAQQALIDLARFWRGRLVGRVIGLTGSSGKTTTKNLVRDVLSAGFAVTATSGNQNNELGVPKTILNASANDGAVVVEMGMRGMGQIEQLCEYARPDWGIVVNIGTSHMELLGSRENIARAKAELLEALPAGGWAFINGADDYASFMCDHAQLRKRGVNIAVFDGSPDAGAHSNLQSDARLWAEDISLDEEGRATFTLFAVGFPTASDSEPGIECATCTLSLRGLHNVGNACAAAAVGRTMGMSLSVIARALSAAQPESGRAQVLRTAAGVTVVDDSYNANPDSMRASLNTFAALKVDGRKIAILGDMGELGPVSEEGHARVGADAAAAGVDLLVCVGPLARGIAQAATQAGLSADRVVCVDDAAAALAYARPLVEKGDAVLVKASHSVGLERVVEGLVD